MQWVFVLVAANLLAAAIGIISYRCATSSEETFLLLGKHLPCKKTAMVVSFVWPPRSSEQGTVGMAGSPRSLTLGIAELLCSVILFIR